MPTNHFGDQFAGRVAVVTGGTQGMGEATARLLAVRGARAVGICGRSVANGERVASDIKKETDCQVLFVPTDLAKVEDCFHFVDEAGARFGRIDIVASCAGTTERGTIDDTTEDVWDRIITINARGPFFVIQRALPWLRKNPLSPAGARGWIVTTISISSHGGQPFLVPYAASKGALKTLTKNIAFGVLQDRIRVNGLNVGWANTPHEHVVQTGYHGKPMDWLETAGPLQPFGRLIEPEEVARAIAFLASDESGLMTGSIIDYDQTVIGCRLKKPGE